MHLGLIISADLSWSDCFQSACSKAKKLLIFCIESTKISLTKPHFSNCINHWFIPTSIMQPLYGILTYSVTSRGSKEQENLPAGYVPKYGILVVTSTCDIYWGKKRGNGLEVPSVYCFVAKWHWLIKKLEVLLQPHAVQESWHLIFTGFA